MKRFLSLMLVVMQLVMLVPAEALAFEDSYTLSAKEVKTISEIAGTNSVYREGMKYSASMSAYQKYCWLEDFCKYNLASVKNQCGSILLDDGEAAKAPEFKAIYRAINDLDQLVQYWACDLEREVTAVESAQTILKDKDNLPGEAAKAYRSLTKSRNRIDEINDEMAEETPSGFAATTDAWFAALQELHEKYVTPAPIRTLSADEFHVIILNSNEFGIQLRTEDKEPVAGAKVTLSDGKKTQTLETGSEGAVVFNGGNFELDDHNEMWGNLYIEKEGMRIYESHGLLMEGGKGLNIVMEPDNGEPYIQYVTFRNMDILHSTETVYQTTANTVQQPFFVGVHIDPGQTATFVLRYFVLNGKEIKEIERPITVPGNKANPQHVYVLDLTDKWCSFLAPKSKVSMELTGTANEALFERECAIQTEKAVEKEPRNFPKGAQSSITNFSLKLDTGISEHFLSEVSIDFDIPFDIDNLIPFSFVLTPEGNFVLSAAFQLGRKFTDKAKEDAEAKEGEEKKKDGWQLQNSIQLRKDLCELATGSQSFKQLAEKNAKQGEPGDIFTWANVKLKAELAGVLSAKLKPGNQVNDPYTGIVDLFFSASLNASFSKSFYFTVLGAPCYAGFDFSIGVMGAIDLPFNCTSKNGEAWKFWEWTDCDFDSKYMDIIIGARIGASGYAGAGIKGLFGICLKGKASFLFGIHIYPNRSGKNVVKGSITLSGSLSLIIDALIVHVNVAICEGEWSDYNPKEESPVSAGGGSLTSDLPRYVPAEVKDAGTLNGVTDVRTVQSGTSFYSFYVEDTVISGTKRPWLRCSVIADDGTLTELPLPRLGEKALAQIGADTFPEDMYVCAFDAASLKDVYNRENGVEVIALEVIFIRRDSLDLLVESYFLYRRSGGDLQQAGSLLHREVVQRSETEDEPPVIGHVNVAICPHRGNTPESVQNFSVMNTFIENDYPLICDTYQQDFKIDPGEQNVTIQSVKPASSSYNLLSKKAFERIEQLEIVREDAETAYAFVLAKKRDSEERTFMGMRLNALGIMNKASVNESISSFKCLPLSSNAGVTVALIHDADNMGRCAISLTEFRRKGDEQYPSFTQPRQIVTKVSPAYFDLVDLGTSRALYYLDNTTEMDGDLAVSTYAIKAIYLADGSDGDTFASHPFHLAEFRPGDLDVNSGAAKLKVSPNNKKFMHGTVLESDSSASHCYHVKQFRFEQTLQVDLQGAYPENVFPKPGETVNLLFPMLNTGNVPLSKVTLSAYATKGGSSEQYPLADIEINCVEPDDSSLINYDLNGEVLSAAEGLRAVSQYDSTIGESMDTFIVGTNASTANAYATNVLMPDEKRIYRSSFTVPESFKIGDYTIHLTPKSFSTLVLRNALGVCDATSAWMTTLENLDGGGKALQSAIDGMPATTLKGLNGNDAFGDEILTLTAYVQDTGSSAGETVPVTLTLTDSEGTPVPLEEEDDLLRAFAQSTIIDTEEIDLDYADLSIEADLSHEAEQEIVHIYIRNESVSAVDNVKLDCDIDGTNCYNAEFNGLGLLYKDTISIDVPLELITGGKEGELLNLNISGNHENEINQFNNTDSVPLLSGFIITRDPSDQYVLNGARAEFTVRARGGEEPYGYQWQISMDGRDGTYRNIDGATDIDLVLKSAKLEQNGAYVRCLVRDKTGETLTSAPALLLVKKVPHTGDATPVGAMLALMLGSAAVIVCLLRRRRHV